MPPCACRYIQQLEREELARSRAMAQLHKELAADARHGRSYSKNGGVANRLVSAWLPLLSQAIEEEQQQVGCRLGSSVERRLVRSRGWAKPAAWWHRQHWQIHLLVVCEF